MGPEFYLKNMLETRFFVRKSLEELDNSKWLWCSCHLSFPI